MNKYPQLVMPFKRKILKYYNKNFKFHTDSHKEQMVEKFRKRNDYDMILMT